MRRMVIHKCILYAIVACNSTCSPKIKDSSFLEVIYKSLFTTITNRRYLDNDLIKVGNLGMTK